MHGGWHFEPCPPKSLVELRKREQTFVVAQLAKFCQKTGNHKRFFSTKQQDRSRERNQVALDFAMKTFFIFLVFTSKFEGKIHTKEG